MCSTHYLTLFDPILLKNLMWQMLKCLKQIETFVVALAFFQ